LGDGKLLSELTGLPVVNNFHKADILAGGQGAPLYPVYFEALCRDIEKPLAVLNIGGISSITMLGQHGEMMAFDIGPGNAAINDWTMRKAGLHMDYNGKLAITGKVNEKIVANLMRNKFFAKYPPKAADRSIFQEKLEHLEGLSLEDGAATVTAFVAEAVSYSMSLYLPTPPKEVIICGGGAKNPTLKRFIRQRLEGTEVKGGEEYGWDVSSVEAQTMAYLAVRRMNNMPSTFPNTTGAQASVIAGYLNKAQGCA
jgi:anhydro-N-acetylmuramic acid kinase